MFILLVGSKGSGKSHIGRTLERHFGVLFFHVELHWKSYYAECLESSRQPVISEALARLHPLIADALCTYEHVCVETTGASAEILNDMLSLEQPEKTLVVRVSAPLELCLERIAARNQNDQVPMDVERIREVYELSEVMQFEPGLTLENLQLTDTEIFAQFERFLSHPAIGLQPNDEI